MKRAGAATPSANRITLLRDADGDGVAETRDCLPERAATRRSAWRWSASDFYVANTDAVMRFPYQEGATQITAAGTKVADLPAGRSTITGPRTSSPAATARKLYVTVGSNSNVARERHGEEEDRAAIWEIDPRPAATQLFASGLRNPNGLAWQPQTGALWTVVNERDELGSDLVPDYLTSVQRRRLLRLALQLLRPACRRAREAAAARPGRQGDRARLRARAAHRLARPGLLRPASCFRRRVSRAARSSASTAPGTASRAAATR